MADKITIELQLTGDGEAKIKKIHGAVEELGNSGGKSLGKLTDAFNVFAGSLAATGVAGAISGLKNAAVALFDTFVVDGVKAAIETESAVNALSAALESNGNLSEETVSSLKALGDELQNTTKYGDDATLSAAAMIETLGGLSGEQLPAATRAAADLASALGKDLNSAAEIVGRAAAGNVAALGKLGFEIRKGESDAQQFARAMEFLNEKFGGRAAKESQTYAGALAKLSNQFEDMTKVVGEAIITNPVLIALFDEVSKIINALTAVLSQNKTEFQEWISLSLKAVVDYAPVVVQALDYVVRAFNAVAGSIKVLFGVFTQLSVPLTIAAKFSDTAKDLRDSFLSVADDGAKQVSKAFAEQTGAAQTLLPLLDEMSTRLNTVGNVAVDTAGRQVNSNRAAREQILQTNQEFDLAELDRETLLQDERTAAFDRILQDTIAENEALAAIDRDANAQKIADNKFTVDTILNNGLASNKSMTEATRKRVDEERRLEEAKARAAQGTLANLAAFQNAKTAEIAAVSKAAAITLATIRTYEAANLALATIPPPFGFIAAAANVAAGLLNVAQISGVGLATGITEVPAGYNNDTFPARLSSGERVVDRGTNQDLKGFLSGDNVMVSLLQGILSRLSNLENTVIVNIGSREIVNEVREGLRSGRELGLA